MIRYHSNVITLDSKLGYGIGTDEPGDAFEIIGVCLTLNGSKLGGNISGISIPSFALVTNCID